MGKQGPHSQHSAITSPRPARAKKPGSMQHAVSNLPTSRRFPQPKTRRASSENINHGLVDNFPSCSPTHRTPHPATRITDWVHVPAWMYEAPVAEVRGQQQYVAPHIKIQAKAQAPAQRSRQGTVGDFRLVGTSPVHVAKQRRRTKASFCRCRMV